MRSILAYLSLFTPACAEAISETPPPLNPDNSGTTPRESTTRTSSQCIPDADGDRVADAADRCPTGRENFNGFQDDDGCADQLPDRLDAALRDYKYSAEEAESLKNHAGVTDALRRKLLEIAHVMNTYSGIVVMIYVFGIAGDEIRHGRIPLQSRADSLKATLQNDGGIDPRRIEAIGLDADNERVIAFGLSVKAVCGE